MSPLSFNLWSCQLSSETIPISNLWDGKSYLTKMVFFAMTMALIDDVLSQT